MKPSPSISWQDFNFIAARIGNNALLVQGPGGNISIKDGATMWVKSSGTWLAEAQKKMVFVPTNLPRLKADLKAGVEKNPKEYALDAAAAAPSMETYFHAALPHTCVVHCHAIAVLRYAVQKKGKTLLTELLQGENWAWVEYETPGFTLAQAVRAHSGADIYILANHGIIVGGDTIADAEKTLQRLCQKLGVVERIALANIPKAHPAPAGYITPTHPEIQLLAHDRIGQAVIQSGIIFPDQAVFLHQHIAFVSTPIEAEQSQKPCVVIANSGVFIKSSFSATAQELLLAVALVSNRLESAEGVAYLSPAHVKALLDSELEKQRKKVN